MNNMYQHFTLLGLIVTTCLFLHSNAFALSIQNNFNPNRNTLNAIAFTGSDISHHTAGVKQIRVMNLV